MRSFLVRPAVAALLMATVLSTVACTTAETGFIAGDLCTMEGVTLCDADGMVILQCADGVWQPIQDCLNGCTEENGIAECIGQAPLDQDTNDIDKPSLPEDDAPIVDDTTPAETETPAGDDTIETDDAAPLDEDTAVADDAAPLDEDTAVADDAAPLDEDTAAADDAAPLDEDTAVADDAAPLDEDVAATDEDGLVADVDNAPVACTGVTLPGTLGNDGNNNFFATYTPNTGSAADDQFQFVIYDANYQFNTPYTLGVGANANIMTCDYFVFIGEDWSGSAWGRKYFAESGTVTLVESGGGCSGGDVYAVFEDVTLREIAVDGDGNSTFVPNGACIELPAYVEMILTPA